MNIEAFQNIIEIQGLRQKIKDHELRIVDHQKRVQQISSLRMEKEQFLDSLKKSLSNTQTESQQTEKELDKLVKTLERDREKMNSVNTLQELKALENEIQSLSLKKEQLEANAFNLLENFEILQNQVTEIEGFLMGSRITLENLMQEVSADCEKERIAVNHLNERINSLKAELPTVVQERLERMWDKVDPLISYVEKTYCKRCGITISALDRSSIEKGTEFKTCTHCGRILVPCEAWN